MDRQDLFATQYSPGAIFSDRTMNSCSAPANISINVYMCKIEFGGCTFIAFDSHGPATGCGMVTTCSAIVSVSGLAIGQYQITSAASFNGGPGYDEYVFPFQGTIITVTSGPQAPPP